MTTASDQPKKRNFLFPLVSPTFWSLVQPLLPCCKPDSAKLGSRKPSAGRPPADQREMFSAIVHILRTGSAWNVLQNNMLSISPSSAHDYYSKWLKAGVFQKIWEKKLAEHDELAGIPWKWQAVIQDRPAGTKSRAPAKLGAKAWAPAAPQSRKKRQSQA